MVNLHLHASSILFMRDVTPTSRLALASLSSMYTNFTIYHAFKVKEMILALGTNKFFLVWT